MSRIEWQHDGRRILVPIEILRPQPTTDLTSVSALALLDTGANVSGIAQHVARTLGLSGMGKRPLISAQGLGHAERYLFRVGLRADGATGFPFVFDETLGLELTDRTGLDAVLGMDVLRQCRFEMRPDSTCMLEFH
jgi:hypothetical protein